MSSFFFFSAFGVVVGLLALAIPFVFLAYYAGRGSTMSAIILGLFVLLNLGAILFLLAFRNDLSALDVHLGVVVGGVVAFMVLAGATIGAFLVGRKRRDQVTMPGPMTVGYQPMPVVALSSFPTTSTTPAPELATSGADLTWTQAEAPKPMPKIIGHDE